MLAWARLRGLVEGLPEPASWTLWFKFAIVQTSNYNTFVQQCLESATPSAAQPRLKDGARATRRPKATPLDQALECRRLARIHHRALTCLYLFFLAKYRLLSLGCDHLRHLDCLVLGRFRFVGRTNIISGEIASVFLFTFLAYRSIVYLCAPRFKFYALEFLMTSREGILDEHLGATNLGAEGRVSGDKRGIGSESQMGYQLRLRNATLLGRLVRQERLSKPSARTINSTIYLQSPFGSARPKWIRRPNRTAKSWLQLNLWTKVLVYWSAYVLVSWSALLYFVLAGSVLSNLGFEMAYPACVAWLRDLQARPGVPNNYSSLYVAPRVLAHEIRIDDIPAWIPVNMRDLQQATWYALTRIAMDLLENHLIYLEGVLLFVTQFYILIIHAVDVALNAAAIKERLGCLLDRLEERTRDCHQRAARLDCYSSFIYAQGELDRAAARGPAVVSPGSASARQQLDAQPPALLSLGTQDRTRTQFYARPRSPGQASGELLDSHADAQLREEIGELQAILADHFRTITRGYNLYVSFMLGIIGLTWLGYTLVVCVWMSSVRSRAIEFEFLFGQSSVTLFCLALTLGTALVRSRNLQLYQLITRAMAHDPDWLVTKPRWTSILRYFYPKPFHCFTLFGTTEISLLLGLKLISWILSAFIVLANFFYTDRF